MSKNNQVTLILDITKNGVECKKPLITIFGSEYIGFPCGKEVGADGKLKLTIPEDVFGVNSCIKGYVQCEECDRCGQLDFEICLCENNDDCSSCSECVGGICTTIECSQPSDCGNNYDCRNCKCECDGFIDEFGQCVECKDKDDCSACETCIKGNCEPIDCGDGICDEGTCVDCLKSGDCDGENECCIGNKCGCCEGFIYDPQLKKCIEIPDCTKDSDCPDCTVCDGQGNCVPRECPENHVCKDDKCVFDPCPDTPCQSGLDCGDDCGCDFETNMCAACRDNPSLPGCTPNCDTPCNNGSDCADGCGCVDGTCVDCSNFDCPECNGVDGCKCDASDNCVADDGECTDELTFEVDGCNLKANLEKNSKCQCEVITGSIQEENYIVRPWTDGISRNFMDFKVDLRKGLATTFASSRALELLTEEFINNEFPIAGSFVVDVYPVYEVIEIIDGVPTPVQVTGAKRPERSKSLINLSEATLTNFVLGENTVDRTLVGYLLEAYIKDLKFESGCIYPKTFIYKSTEIEKLTADVTAAGPLKSSSDRNPKFTFSRDGVKFRSLYKTTNVVGRFEDILYGPKMFASDDERGQQTLVLPQGEIIPLKDYLLEVDCSCDSPEIIENLIICDIEFVRGVHFEITTQGTDTCNNRINLLKDFDVCPINQNLEYFGWGANHPSQTKYILKVNGNVVKTFVYENTSDTTGRLRSEDGVLFEQFIYVNGSFDSNDIATSNFISEPITSVSLEMNHDPSCKKEATIDTNIKDPKIDLECTNGSVIATITGNQTAVTAAGIKGSGLTEAINGSVVINGILSGVTKTIVVQFEGGCRKEYDIVKDCCVEDSLSVDVKQIPLQPAFVNLVVSTSNLAELSTLTVNGQVVDLTGPLVTNVGNVYTVKYINTIFLVDFEVTTIAGCTYTTQEEIIPSEDDIDINPDIVCETNTSNVTLSTDSPNTPFILQGPTTQYTGVTNAIGGAVIEVEDSGNYQIINFNNEVVQNSKIVSLSVITSPEVTSLNAPAQICSNEDIVVTVTGTPNTVVTVFDGTTTRNVNINSTGVGTTTYNYGVAGTYTFEANSIASGTCSVTTSVADSTVVLEGPTLIVDSVTCVTPITSNSNIDINVISTTGATVVAGGITLTEGTPTIFQGTIPTGSGQTITVTSTLNSCTRTIEYSIPNCDCPTVSNPLYTNPQGLYTSCDGSAVLLEVSNPDPANYIIEWYNTTDTSGTPIQTGTTYSTSTPGAYFVIAVDTATDCESSPIELNIITENFDLVVSNDPSVCIGESKTITASTIPSNANVVTYEYIVDGVSIYTGPNSSVSHQFSTLGTFVIEVLATTALGCTETETSSIDVITCCTPPATVTLTERFAMVSGGSYPVGDDEAGGGTNCVECGNLGPNGQVNPPYSGLVSGLPANAVATVTVTGDASLQSSSTVSNGDSVEICYTNTSSGTFSATITLNYCNTDYIFNITAGGC